MFQPPRGTRDLPPAEMKKRLFVLDKIRERFELWGFEPLETPAFESWELLAKKFGGGEEIKKEIYYFKDKSNRELGLRFDLTVPMARYVASSSLTKPFKRYQIGRVWRYDRPGAGRWREFWQADIDVVGSKEPEADALVVAVCCDVLEQLGIKNFTIKINNRKLIEGFLQSIKIDNVLDVMRSIDKIEKFGEEEVEKELKNIIPEEKIKRIFNFIKTGFENIEPKNELMKQGTKEINDFVSLIKEFGFEKYIKIDLSIVRGLDYYTGLVFETMLPKYKLTVAAGGRYDNLIELFGGKPTPATGISFGIDRLIESVTDYREKSKIMIAIVKPDFLKDAIKLSRDLIKLGIKCEFDVAKRNLKKQFDYANKKKIPFVIILGEKEIKNKEMKLRDMVTGKETKIKDIKKIRKIIDRFNAKR